VVLPYVLKVIDFKCLEKSISKHFYRTVKPVYNGHSREPGNMAFMSSCTVYTG